ncbi:MAG TPA: hypothetical protein VF656_08675 [Pyrinomonadaceae bacterium]|jgi:cbb3-type cytochrome oxidase subunit 3
MNSETTELYVIGAAMLIFLFICVVAVWAFARQYRREHPRDDGRRDER